MPRFLVESPHDSDQVACTRAVHVFLSTGSHFLTHAEWGCKDGVHSAWIMVDVESKADARAMLPPGFREGARIVMLTRFHLPEIEAALRRFAARDARGASGG